MLGRALLVAALLLVASTCDGPSRKGEERESARPVRSRLGYLRTRDAKIPLEEIFGKRAAGPDARAFRDDIDPSQLEAGRLMGDLDL